VFCWRADCGGKTIEGVDVVRVNEDGQVDEIRVLIRPLVSIALFAQTLGPPLAGDPPWLGPPGAYPQPLVAVLGEGPTSSSPLLSTAMHGVKAGQARPVG
jgi:hypothetical protein